MRQPKFYRKRPAVIQAFKLGTDPLPDWFIDARIRNDVTTFNLGGVGFDAHGKARNLVSARIKTLEGRMLVEDGDWIICGVKGEIYSCKPDVFALTYEPVSDGHQT